VGLTIVCGGVRRCWGIEDETKKVVGTTFKPRQTKKGNEELENWLMRSLHPQVNFKIHE
jgi:hypothetical protein